MTLKPMTLKTVNILAFCAAMGAAQAMAQQPGGGASGTYGDGAKGGMMVPDTEVDGAPGLADRLNLAPQEMAVGVPEAPGEIAPGFEPLTDPDAAEMRQPLGIARAGCPEDSTLMHADLLGVTVWGDSGEEIAVVVGLTHTETGMLDQLLVGTPMAPRVLNRDAVEMAVGAKCAIYLSSEDDVELSDLPRFKG